MKEALREELQQEIIEENEKIPAASSSSGPNRLPPRPLSTNSNTEKSNSNTSLKQKKFDLQEVEIWIVLASLLGAILALITFQLCKLCKIRIFAKKYPDICHIESQKVFDSVIQDGLATVSKTKKVVVMNVHLVPCNHHPNANPNQIRINKQARVLAMSTTTVRHAGC